MRRHDATIATADQIAALASGAPDGARGLVDGFAGTLGNYQLRYSRQGVKLHLTTEGANRQLRAFGARAMIAAMERLGWTHAGAGIFQR